MPGPDASVLGPTIDPITYLLYVPVSLEVFKSMCKKEIPYTQRPGTVDLLSYLHTRLLAMCKQSTTKGAIYTTTIAVVSPAEDAPCRLFVSEMNTKLTATTSSTRTLLPCVWSGRALLAVVCRNEGKPYSAPYTSAEVADFVLHFQRVCASNNATLPRMPAALAASTPKTFVTAVASLTFSVSWFL